MERITEVRVNNEWKNKDFKNLAVGDIFRLWETEGEITLGEPMTLKRVHDNEGYNVWTCDSLPAAHTNENGVDTLMVRCTSLEKEGGSWQE